MRFSSYIFQPGPALGVIVFAGASSLQPWDAAANCWPLRDAYEGNGHLDATRLDPEKGLGLRLIIETRLDTLFRVPYIIHYPFVTVSTNLRSDGLWGRSSSHRVDPLCWRAPSALIFWR